MKQYCIFDILKFILAIGVIIIHSLVFPFIFMPWVRIAVPLFFTISSYLLFSKINMFPRSENKPIIKKFIFRNIKLYIFWFILLLPITVVNRWGWFDSGFLIGLSRLFKNAIFSSTFPASWFITALIWAVLIVYKFYNCKNYKLWIVITGFIWILCCIKSSWYSIFVNYNFIKNIYHYYTFLMPSPIFSFPVALFWVVLGKIYADEKVNIHSINIYLTIAVISAILLFIEWKFVYFLNSTYSNDCYLFIMPLVFSIFGILKTVNIDIKLKTSVLLRKISVIFYCLHLSVINTLRFVAKNILHLSINESSKSVVIFFLTIIICLLTCLFIFKFENKKHFSILKYSH